MTFQSTFRCNLLFTLLCPTILSDQAKLCYQKHIFICLFTLSFASFIHHIHELILFAIYVCCPINVYIVEYLQRCYLLLLENNDRSCPHAATATADAKNPAAYLTISSWWKKGNSLSQFRSSARISSSLDILSLSRSSDLTLRQNLRCMKYILYDALCKWSMFVQWQSCKIQAKWKR